MSHEGATYNLDGEVDRQGEELQRALDVYRQRDGVRQGLWKEYTPRDQMVQVKIKVERMLSILSMTDPTDEQLEEVLKEAPDVHNYVAFTTRLLRRRMNPGQTYV